MGEVKFVPNLEQDQFALIVNESKANKTDTYAIQGLWNKCKGPIFNLTEQTKCLGFSNEGVTTYHSDNCTIEDSKLVKEWLKLKQIEGYISRTFKTVSNDGRISYEIRIASVECDSHNGITSEAEQFKGAWFQFTRGDYSPMLELVNSNLLEALKYAANQNQINTINDYVNSFAEGDIDAHKNATRL